LAFGTVDVKVLAGDTQDGKPVTQVVVGSFVVTKSQLLPKT
jgi:hypothetical protein